ncbi:MAG: Gfo/Idh/MocA family oxidoreductase [Clostridia bacterium]|nr:Gfo/Idh/MocA family oxidoreductase [Clostridia bacterium]
MSKELKTVLFGTGGYAANYLEAFKKPLRENVRLVGAVDPFAQTCALCPLYEDAETMLRELRPDIAIISTPIQLHTRQAELAFAHGCHVVLEKPIAATVESAQAILEARDRAGKLLNIDYHWCYSPAMRAMKADADAGRFGAPRSLRVLVLWPRGHAYYRRGTGWAGKKMDGEGQPIYDSVLNNATAHYLMNMLFILGAPAENIRCATFRANAIETYDTAVLTAKAAGADIFLAVSHAIHGTEKQEPLFEYRYEKAAIRFGVPGGRGGSLRAYFDSGEVKDYGGMDPPYMENLWNMVDAIRGEGDILCSGETALLQTRAVEEMRALQPEARPFPEAWIRREETMTWVPGLAKALWACYEGRNLPDWEAQGNIL